MAHPCARLLANVCNRVGGIAIVSIFCGGGWRERSLVELRSTTIPFPMGWSRCGTVVPRILDQWVVSSNPAGVQDWSFFKRYNAFAPQPCPGKNIVSIIDWKWNLICWHSSQSHLSLTYVCRHVRRFKSTRAKKYFTNITYNTARVTRDRCYDFFKYFRRKI
jgi:hypothetical protein